MLKMVSAILLFSLLVGHALGQPICKEYGSIKTPKGVIQDQVCEVPNEPGSSISRILLNNLVLLQGKYPITFEDRNKEKTLLVLQGASIPDLACSPRTFLIDLTGDKPRVFAFGVKNACAEYHWASWGKKRSVIAIKDNIRFTYSNSKLSPPPNDFGDGTPLSRRYPEDGKPQRLWPFVEELSIK